MHMYSKLDTILMNIMLIRLCDEVIITVSVLCEMIATFPMNSDNERESK